MTVPTLSGMPPFLTLVTLCAANFDCVTRVVAHQKTEAPVDLSRVSPHYGPSNGSSVSLDRYDGILAVGGALHSVGFVSKLDGP